MSDKAEAAFAASLAAAIAMEPSTDDSADEAPDPSAVADEADTSEADGAGADDATGDDEAEDSADDDSATGVSAAKELFLAGDKAAALKALGLDPKILDLNDAKFRTMRQGLKEADKKLAEANRLHTEGTAAKEEAARMYEQGKQELGPVLRMRRLLAKGDYASAKDLLEALAPPGTTYRQIAEGIAAAASGMSPAEQLYRKKLREIDEAEQAKKEPEKKAPPPADTSKNLEGAKKMLSSTDLKDIPGAAEALVRVAAENWDAEKKGFKVPKAKLVELVRQDTVIAQLLELRALKSKGKKAPEPEPEVEEDEEAEKPRDRSGRFRERPRRPPAPKLTPQQEKEAAAERRFQASLAAAREMEKTNQRKAGKGRR